MFRKTILILIVLFIACVVAIMLSVIDTAEVDAEKPTEIAEISKKPNIVALSKVMITFRNSLSEELLTAASYPLGHKESYSWSNLPASRNRDRGGIDFAKLTLDQLTLFHKVLDAFLSDEGMTKVSLITKKAKTKLSDMKADFWKSRPYFIALFGNPETDGSWGFQLDGHHLALNFLVHGDEVTIVPNHLGTQPTIIDGAIVLEDERMHALALLNSLDGNQKTKAIQKGTRRGLKVGPGSTTDPYLNYDYSNFVGVGLKASDMDDTQKEKLRELIKTYVYNLETEFADIWMKDIDADLDNTYFAWIGGTTENDSIYYRVFNPAVWIEFNDEARGGDGKPNHIHTITRAPNGKDYGIFALNKGPRTLLEHYAMADHHHGSNMLFDYHITDFVNVKITKEH